MQSDLNWKPINFELILISQEEGEVVPLDTN